MDGAVSGRSGTVEIVAWVHANDSALCAMVEVDGVIWAAANMRMSGQAVAHIRQHAARGFTGRLVCAVDCVG